MKKLQTLVIILVLLIFTPHLKAQDRIQSLSTGISLLGTSKPNINSYLSNIGFSYNNSSGNLYSYIKRVQFGSNTFMVAYKNQVVDEIAWTEHIAHLQNVLSEIKSTGFDDERGLNGGEIYSFQNYYRNIHLTLIIREDMNDFQITIGKINSGKAVIKSNLNNYPTENTNDNTININYVVIAQKTYFYNLDASGGIGQKRQAYLVKGENIKGLKEKDAYVYCVFTNSTTKKTSKGWICKMDLGEAPSDSLIAVVKKENDSIIIADGSKPDLTFNEMLEFVRRDNFTAQEIEKYLSQTCTLKMPIDGQSPNFHFSGNGNDVNFDNDKHIFIISSDYEDEFVGFIKQLKKDGYKKKIQHPAEGDIAAFSYQNKNYLVNYSFGRGGSMGNSPCTLTISRETTFSNH